MLYFRIIVLDFFLSFFLPFFSIIFQLVATFPNPRLFTIRKYYNYSKKKMMLSSIWKPYVWIQHDATMCYLGCWLNCGSNAKYNLISKDPIRFYEFCQFPFFLLALSCLLLWLLENIHFCYSMAIELGYFLLSITTWTCHYFFLFFPRSLPISYNPGLKPCVLPC